MTTSHPLARLVLAVFAGVLVSPLPGRSADPVPFVWIEAESPATSTPSREAGRCGPPDWLSGGKWLFLQV